MAAGLGLRGQGLKMGRQAVEQVVDEHQQRVFMKAILNDLRALEQMLKDGLVESGIRRIGAEQEMFLVDSVWGLPRTPEAAHCTTSAGSWARLSGSL
jgi:hypothetical protein